MVRRRTGKITQYNSYKNCFEFGEVEIYELEEFLGLQLRWRDTNALASYDQKEAEWNRLCYCITLKRMYEWRDEYIAEWFDKNGKMYLPSKYYNRLLREIKA